MTWVRVVAGKLVPMADVEDFWGEAIRIGVEALDFTLLRSLTAPPLMIAELSRHDLPGPAMRAAQAAMVLDLEIEARVGRITPIVMARKILSQRLEVAPCSKYELVVYRRLLSRELQKLVAADPATGLARLVA